MPYTHFRFIAYEVPTATYQLGNPNAAVESGFPAGNPCPPVPRIPVNPATPIDARTRLLRLAAVVDRAVTHIKTRAVDGSNILKVFIVPEFYFRPPPQDAQGVAYPFNTYPRDEGYALLDQLERMFAHTDLRDWLIIPGTMMWNEAMPGQAANGLIRNTGGWIRGGVRESLHLVEKAVPSHIDGVPYPRQLANGQVRYVNNFDPYLSNAIEHWTHRRGHVFDVDNVSCGLEICLDHADDPQNKVLKKCLADWRREEATYKVKEISLHLLTAGGMDIEAGSVAARPLGYILRNDGLDDVASSELKRVGRYKKNLPAYDPAYPRKANTFPDDLSGRAKFSKDYFPEDGIDLAGDELVPSMPGGNYFSFPQKLAIYKPLPLP